MCIFFLIVLDFFIPSFFFMLPKDEKSDFGWNWPKMGQIRYFSRSDFSKFVPDVSDFWPIWHFGPKFNKPDHWSYLSTLITETFSLSHSRVLTTSKTNVSTTAFSLKSAKCSPTTRIPTLTTTTTTGAPVSSSTRTPPPVTKTTATPGVQAASLPPTAARWVDTRGQAELDAIWVRLALVSKIWDFKIRVK